MKKQLLLMMLGLFLLQFSNAQVSKTNNTSGTVFSTGPNHMDRTFTFTAGEFSSTSLTEVELSLQLIIGNGSPPTLGGYGVHEDLNVRLVSPTGTAVDLVQDRWGYWTGNPSQLNSFHLFPAIEATVNFDDDNSTNIETLDNWQAGNFAPHNPLSAFDGENPAGTWTLRISDGNSQFAASDYFHFVTATITVTSGISNTAPVISGTSSGQGVLDNDTLSPFSTIAITDADGDNVSVIITLDDNAKGILSGTGLTGSGPYAIASTTAADLQTKLRSLSFNPTDNRTSTTETTTFTVVLDDGSDTDSDNTTTVISSAVAPTVSSVSVPASATYVTGQNLNFIINFSENVTVNTIGGTPQMSVTIGATARQAVYLSGSGTSALLFRYTIQAGGLDTDGIAVGTLSENGGTLRDSGSKDVNPVLNSVGSTASVLVDAVAPTVSSVTVPADATYVAGQNLDFTINTDENVTVNAGGGTPQLSLTVGATTRQAVYQSGSGTSALLFRYTVQAGELDTDGIAIGTLGANGGTLRDGVGNDLNTTLNSVGSTTAVLVDAAAPTISSVTVPADATYVAGQNLDFTINTDENVMVNTGGGTPQLSLTVGATTRQAIYQSGSGTSALLFRYTVQVGDLDTDGIAIGTLGANGGTLRDGVGNDLNTTLNSIGATTAVLVDATLSINNIENTSKFSMYPNPSFNHMKIKSSLGGDYNIINQLGQIVKTFKVNANMESTIYIGDLSGGMYIVKAINSSNKSSQKLVVKK
ncbi:T9SS type A sorting domain-containing protein [Flavivirga sp. 57AJ16]|uniref:T9SS type A sorting domain-containing protein n=1 Tax=Flavivirga sp. 57AJ16 TaxID=3025307 RepID=UPI002365F862|nr:T9SS type A sorting domain-containing protein [Flavivirga sp. 57AJ16]MDD7885768.1 T9SS type A sorting domain-containing protein [Flavivirga sp. 57AJ16]